MRSVDFRPMTAEEQQLMERLLSPSFPGRDQIREQLRYAKVRTIDENHSLEFLLPGGSKADEVKYVTPTEGEYEDADGITVHVVLHVRDTVKELEFYREDNAIVQKWPHLQELRVFAPE